MPRFVFKLEPVLEQRRRREREQRRVVAELERKRANIEEHIRSCQSRIIQEKRDLEERLGSARAGGAVDLAGARVQASASLHLTAQAQRAVIELAGVHKRLDNERLELVQRATDRRSIEHLKERRLAEWKHAQNKAEAAALDDIAVTRFGRSDHTDNRTTN